jgi:hypothetical protein
MLIRSRGTRTSLRYLVVYQRQHTAGAFGMETCVAMKVSPSSSQLELIATNLIESTGAVGTKRSSCTGSPIDDTRLPRLHY